MPNKPSMRAWVAEADGSIIAVFGYAFIQGQWLAFCDLEPEGRKYKKLIVKWGRILVDEARKQGIRYLYADVDQTEQNAERWLSRLGFELDPRSQHLFRWKA